MEGPNKTFDPLCHRFCVRKLREHQLIEALVNQLVPLLVLNQMVADDPGSPRPLRYLQCRHDDERPEVSRRVIPLGIGSRTEVTKPDFLPVGLGYLPVTLRALAPFHWALEVLTVEPPKVRVYGAIRFRTVESSSPHGLRLFRRAFGCARAASESGADSENDREPNPSHEHLDGWREV